VFVQKRSDLNKAEIATFNPFFYVNRSSGNQVVVGRVPHFFEFASFSMQFLILFLVLCMSLGNMQTTSGSLSSKDAAAKSSGSTNLSSSLNDLFKGNEIAGSRNVLDPSLSVPPTYSRGD
jgi:hypothetical protein